jgi:hypothetical protein
MASSAQLKNHAAAFLKSCPPAQPAQLRALLEKTAEHLRLAYVGISQTAAHQAAVRAWSEIAAAQARVYVDLEASTPQLLVLVDEVSKTRRLFPVADLVRILGPRVAAA